MIIYFDTSDLVKLYVEEIGSERVKGIVSTATVVSTSKTALSKQGLPLHGSKKTMGFL